ncbi:MAG: site-2 protease family protein [Gammaproteobacteria bacterium]|nr:site-2 protease family protein [Gammaproteobacteria bacterium]
MTELSTVQQIIVGILPMIFAITVHEAAHGWVAKKYGDPTADQLGRLTLNPIKHIDLLGTVILPGLLLILKTGFVFGWAKPVPVNTRNFKKPISDMAVVALAGPVSNLLMAVFWALISRIGLMIGDSAESIAMPLIYTGLAGISINLSLALLNLIPIPPLDGSRIVTAWLPPRLAWQYNQLERYGFIILLILLYTNILSAVLKYPMLFAQELFLSIAGL